MGDGWFPPFRPDESGRAILDRLHTYTRQACRDPADIGISGGITVGRRSPDQWVEDAIAWKEFGATHLSANTRGEGLSFPEGHIDAIRRFNEALAYASDLHD
jgi:hypothetical protein